MGKTKVLFLEDVGRSGRAGEVREVANGYARNYLLPRSLAVPATKDQLQRVEKIRKAADGRRDREQQDMKTLAERLEGTTVEFSMRSSSSGRLFGSVTNIHIAEKLSGMLDVPVDRRTVSLGDPIRQPGSFEVEIRLPQQMSATITVVVEGVGPGARQVAATEAAEEEPVSFEEAVTQIEEVGTATDEAAAAIAEAEPTEATASLETADADEAEESPAEDDTAAQSALAEEEPKEEPPAEDGSAEEKEEPPR